MVLFYSYIKASFALSFFIFFVILSFSFWGRYILKLLTGKMYSYGSIEPLISGMVSVVTILAWNYMLGGTYFKPLWAISVYGSICGLCIELLRFVSANSFLVKVKCELSENIIFCLVVIPILSLSVIYIQGEPWGGFNYSILNNDIYNWSLSADTIRGIKAFDNIPVLSKDYLYLLPGLGTSVFFAYISNYTSLPAVHSVIYVTATLLAIFSVSLCCIIGRYFNADMSFRIFSTVFVVFSSMMVYIAFNGFLAQLLAYCCIYQMAIACDDRKSFKDSLILVSFPIAGIYLCYPHGGGIVFPGIAFMLSVVFFMINSKELSVLSLIRYVFKKILFPFGCSLILVILLTSVSYPDILLSFYYNGIIAGYGLPSVTVAGWLGIPTLSFVFFEQIDLFLLSYLLCFIVLLIAVFRCAPPKKNMLFLAPLALSVCAYILVVYVRGGSYQAWKFATFTAVPLFFLTYYVLYLVIASTIFFRRKLFKATISVCLVSLFVATYFF